MEVIGAWLDRAQAKRRKASASGEPACSGEARNPSATRVYWRRGSHEDCWSYPGRSAGFRASGSPENARTEDDEPAEVRWSRSTGSPPKGGPKPSCRQRWWREGDHGRATGGQTGTLLGTAEEGGQRPTRRLRIDPWRTTDWLADGAEAEELESTSLMGAKELRRTGPMMGGRRKGPATRNEPNGPRTLCIRANELNMYRASVERPG